MTRGRKRKVKTQGHWERRREREDLHLVREQRRHRRRIRRIRFRRLRQRSSIFQIFLKVNLRLQQFTPLIRTKHYNNLCTTLSPLPVRISLPQLSQFSILPISPLIPQVRLSRPCLLMRCRLRALPPKTPSLLLHNKDLHHRELMALLTEDLLLPLLSEELPISSLPLPTSLPSQTARHIQRLKSERTALDTAFASRAVRCPHYRRWQLPLSCTRGPGSRECRPARRGTCSFTF